MEDAPSLPFLDIVPSGLVITVYVQPKASRNMIVGPHGNALKIKLTAPPVDGAANKMCVDFLAKRFKVPKSAIDILSGHTGRNKRLEIRTPDAQIKTGILTLLQKYGEAPKSP